MGCSAGIPELLSRAVRYHRANQLVDAENCYRNILAADEGHFHGLHLLGVLAQQVGQSDLAEQLIGRAIALHDYRNFSSDLAPARGSAIPRRNLAEAHSNFSIVLMTLGRPAEALNAIQRSIALEETENTKLLFVQCVQNLKFVPRDSEFRNNLLRALSEPWGRPNDLARIAADLIKRDGSTGARIQRFRNAGLGRPGPQDVITPAELTEICGDPLLHSLLEATTIFDMELERYLTAARHTMLAMAIGTETPRKYEEKMLCFFCALSRQCFINEYVFACGDQEKELVEQLRLLLANALDYGDSIPELWLPAVAAYVPLASLPAANFLAQRRWSEPVARLVTAHVQEVEQERQLQASVPRLTSIDERVSLAVRRQYEENPYPRWVRASPMGMPATLGDHLREQFPSLDPRDLPTVAAPEILIAGCGTGQHPIETARRFKDARVLAIDLSLASLSYAKRKTRDLGVKNIEYGQADILQLGSIGRAFDVIEASGVLHHLSDPMVGWQELLRLLRPGGVMRLGLYSALARQDLTAAREFIAQGCRGASADDIRRCRQELVNAGESTPVARVANWSDFFSTSSCRDLLFHVQEHQMSLPEIDAFLRQNALQFLGFILPNSVRETYRRCFPNDKTMTDLTLWHAFEKENPATFVAMYQFWIRKAQ